LKEPLKGEASPSPLKRGEASQKGNGLQREFGAALKKTTSALANPFFEKPKRWKAGDPDEELTEEEVRELRKLQ
jgi:hypothetical protein